METSELQSRNQSQSDGESGGGDKVIERIHALETAQAVQAATMAGAEATQAAVQAGITSTGAATAAGNMAAMVVGSVSLVVGIFLGITIGKAACRPN